MKNTISIIIPVWNEAKHIGELLRYLIVSSTEENIDEIIVVDGGSTDNSCEIIANFEQVILIKSQKGRAKQLNAGAKFAKGAILYFLHADTFPPADFDKKIISEIKNKNAGCFRLKFDHADHFLLKIAPWFTQFNSSLFRGGDQSLFIKKEDFENLNGFNEQYVIYEDIEFINRLIKYQKFKIINDFVRTSARKFKKNGTWKLYFNFLMIHIKNSLGASPEELHKYYIEHIKT